MTALGSGAHAAEWEGRRIVRLTHQPKTLGERKLSEAELAESLTVRVGEPYSARKIGESIERLFAAGRFVDIYTTAEAEGDGVAVAFVTLGQYFVGDIIVRGVKPPPIGAWMMGCWMPSRSCRR